MCGFYDDERFFACPFDAERAEITEHVKMLEEILCELWSDACSPYVRGLWAESVARLEVDGLVMADVLARNGYPEVDDEGREVDS